MKTLRHYIFFVLILLWVVLSCKPIYERRFPKNILKVPLIRQSTSYTCGTASLQSVFCYYGDDWREDYLAAKLGSDSINGTSYLNMIKFSKSEGYKTWSNTNLTIDSLKKYIKKKVPVIVAFQAWRSDTTINYKNAWDYGHYAVVVGLTKKNIYFMDPSTLGNYTYIPIAEFLERWHDITGDSIKLNRFGIVIYKDTIKYDYSKVFKLE